jgi:hypothetical protein
MSQVRGLGVVAADSAGAQWDFLPSTASPQRAIPRDTAARGKGQAFSAALNAALKAHGIDATVQTDGVISLFHIEQLGELVFAGVKFLPQEVDAGALLSSGAAQVEALAELVGENLLPEITDRLVFAKGSGAASKTSSRVLPLVIGGGVIGLFLIARAAR